MPPPPKPRTRTLTSLTRSKFKHDPLLFVTRIIDLTDNVPVSTRIDRLLTLSTTGNMGTVDVVANGLGYLVGAGSLLLYTPIAVRISRQRSADGLALSTWWLKVISYTFSDLYGYANGYNLSTYAETLVITIEAAIVLLLVGFFQSKIFQPNFYIPFGSYLLLTLVVIFNAASLLSVIAVGQALSTVLNICAILPQLRLNHQRQSSGDYSPVTATLACVGCAIRLFTTITLNDSDFLLLTGFGLAFLINMALLCQIVYFGVVVEGKGLLAVWTADVVTNASSSHIELASADDEDESGRSDDEEVGSPNDDEDDHGALVHRSGLS